MASTKIRLKNYVGVNSTVIGDEHKVHFDNNGCVSSWASNIHSCGGALINSFRKHDGDYQNVYIFFPSLPQDIKASIIKLKNYLLN